ncbi:unnamed protein product [Onchocerca flexuosa]|uniref:MAM domain-containing protein n=1 Tax=Onchocerca flexuosa TaxID=387005 RepID=A0A183HY25_9BILA|nr:unnamed protein product [Onchocerca flexuosa]
MTTSNLLPYNSNETDMAIVGYNCTFDDPCRWFSEGITTDRWRLAHGKPEALLWLASAGTIQRPAELFALIELHGEQADRFLSDKIPCQDGNATLSFTYWIVEIVRINDLFWPEFQIIGDAKLEVCLIDSLNEKFNCTDMLSAQPIPRKVLLSLPQVQEPFRVISLKLNLICILIFTEILCNQFVPKSFAINLFLHIYTDHCLCHRSLLYRI